jgi:hypothetical protein
MEGVGAQITHIRLAWSRRMNKVAFIVPINPTEGFFSQIAALNLALGALDWRRWNPSLHILVGGDLDVRTFQRWQPYLLEASTILVPPAQFAREGIWAQSDGVFRWIPGDADVIVAVDADILPVGDLEGVLDCVVDTTSVAGVIAHYTFPFWPGRQSREAWERVREGLVRQSLRFEHSYSLAGADSHPDEQRTPFYPNFGIVFFPRSIFPVLAAKYLYLRPKVAERLPDPYFSGQVALALAIAEMGTSTWALPMRFNFPNDTSAVSRYPDELDQVAVFHYLRTETFDRARIFANAAEYDRFLHAPLEGVDRIFQQYVRKILGPNYPFAAVHANSDSAGTLVRRGKPDTLSLEAYEKALPMRRQRLILKRLLWTVRHGVLPGRIRRQPGSRS